MALGRSLSDVLDECMDRVALGESVEVCLADYPEYAAEMRDELEAAVLFRDAFDFQPSADAKRAARVRMLDALEKKQRRRFPIRLALPRSWYATGTRMAATAAVAVVALVVSGTGTVMASQSSTPGDILYPVKRTGEQVQLAFAFSDNREAELRDTLVERRMEELDRVTASGRERFVPDLVDQIIEHSTRARVLASAPVQEIVDTLPGIDALPTLEPVGVGNVVATPMPTPTARVTERTDRQVSVAPVLTLAGELDSIGARLEAIEADVIDEDSREELARLRKSLNQTKQQLNRLINRADQVHNPDVVERPIDRDDTDSDDETVEPTATPEPVDPPETETNGRRTGVIKDVLFQEEKGKLARVDVIVILESDGAMLEVQIARGGTRLLKDGKGVSVNKLRPEQRVELSVNERTGEVLAISILATPSRESDENNRGARSGTTSDDVVAPGEGASSRANAALAKSAH